MLSVYLPTQNGSHTLIGESTFLVDRQLTINWDAFTEYAGEFSHAGGPRDLLHFGTAYKIGARQQLDLHVGVGLSAAAVDHLIGIGYSLRVPMGRRDEGGHSATPGRYMVMVRPGSYGAYEVA
jgi:hypothetical protein